jgi:hypothetical protein
MKVCANPGLWARSKKQEAKFSYLFVVNEKARWLIACKLK